MKRISPARGQVQTSHTLPSCTPSLRVAVCGINFNPHLLNQTSTHTAEKQYQITPESKQKTPPNTGRNQKNTQKPPSRLFSSNSRAIQYRNRPQNNRKTPPNTQKTPKNKPKPTPTKQGGGRRTSEPSPHTHATGSDTHNNP